MPPGRDDVGRPPQDLYKGVLPVIPPDTADFDKQSRNNAATAASAAGVRALSAQAIAFYFRAPVKAFFRTRVDYLAYARSVHQAQTELLAQAAANDHTTSRLRLALKQAWMWARGTTPGLLKAVIDEHGWGVIPHQILPPLLANVGVNTVLYTSYLHILGQLHEESSRPAKRVFPPPEPTQTFTAGLLAGSLQSVLAAPLDAIQARYDHHDLMAASEDGRPKSMWTFSAEKLKEIGPRGVFAGWGLSLTKDSLGCAIFFSTFEYVKAQGYYRFVRWYYSGLRPDTVDNLARKRPPKNQGLLDSTAKNNQGGPVVIRPHYAIEPMFLLLAGISASSAQQFLLHPLTHIQVLYWDHLEDLDEKAAKLRRLGAANPDKPKHRWRMLRAYYHAYQETWAECTAIAASEGMGVTQWLYRGFWRNTIRQVPSTSAGLIIFELVRRKYGGGNEPVRVAKDNYEILLE